MDMPGDHPSKMQSYGINKFGCSTPSITLKDALFADNTCRLQHGKKTEIQHIKSTEIEVRLWLKYPHF